MQTPDPTPLDLALADAQRDKEQAGVFYNLLLNTDLFLPTRPQDPGDTKETVNLLIVQNEHGLFLPAFDTLPRLEAWAQGPAAHVKVRCYALLKTLGKEHQMVLNAGTGKARGFGIQELDWLRRIVDEAMPGPAPGGS